MMVVVVQPNGSSWNSLITDLAVNVGETYYVRFQDILKQLQEHSV
jgi:hypothetical protein